jgi:broad specificity polyphosphatase/5'/3'-nucleotidase SurE
MAVSLASPSPRHRETAGEVASHLTPILVSSTAPVMLNVNVPDVERPEIRGHAEVVVAVGERLPPGGRLGESERGARLERPRRSWWPP